MVVEKFKNILSDLLDPIIVIDDKGVITWFNQSTPGFFGYLDDELYGQNINMLMSDSYLQNYIAGAPAKNLGQIGVEVEAKRKDGSLVSILLRVSEHFNQGERYFAGQLSDITELSNVKSQLESILISTPCTITMTDLDLNIQYINRTVPGLKREDVLNKCALDYFDEKNREIILKNVRMCLEENKPVEYITEYVGESKEKIYHQSVLNSIVRNKKKVGFVFLSHDATETYENQKNLNVIVDILNETQKLAKVGGWKLDLWNDQVEWTDETYRIHEIPIGSQIKLQNAINHYLGQDRIRIAKYVEDIQKKGISYDDEFEFITAKGNKIWVRTTGCPVYDNEGLISHIVGTFQDITEQKKRELLIRENFKLVQLGELAAGIGHEINNPLAISTGYINKMSRLLDSEHFDRNEMQSFLNKTQEANKRIAGIVSGLSSLAKEHSLDSGGVSVNQVIHQTLSFIQEMYKSEGIEIITEGLDTEIKAIGNFGKIQQVLMNLLNNAKQELRDTVDAQVHVTLRSVAGFVSILVSDNGDGVIEENKEKIFHAFFTTKLENKGTGLGLSISKKIAREMGGDLLLVENNEGACFELRLQRCPTEFDQTRKHSVSVNSLISREILIVDDEISLLDLLSDILKELGQKVTMVNNAHEAIDLVRERKYDMIISDIKMPGLNGITFLKEILKMNLNEFPIFYFQTGGVDMDSLSKLVPEIKEAVSGIIKKPYDEEVLKRILYQTNKSF